MKKLITLLFLVALTVTVTAQRSGSTTSVPANIIGTKSLTMTAADTISKNANTYWIFDINRPAPALFAFVVKLDTTRATGMHVWADVYQGIDTINWAATSATEVKFGGTVDSSFILSDVTTGAIGRYLKLVLKGKNLAVKGNKVSAISLRVLNK